MTKVFLWGAVLVVVVGGVWWIVSQNADGTLDYSGPDTEETGNNNEPFGSSDDRGAKNAEYIVKNGFDGFLQGLFLDGRIGTSGVSKIESSRKVDWPDACLGRPLTPYEPCAEVVTPGYEVIASYNSVDYDWRLDEKGTLVRPPIEEMMKIGN